MQKDNIKDILQQYKSDKISEDEVLEILHNLPYEDITFAKIDHHRSVRWGFPEVILCQGKTPEQVAAIAEKLISKGSNLLATRASKEAYNAVKEILPQAEYDETGKVITLVKNKIKSLKGNVLILTAGTSDIPVSTEALITGRMLGLNISMISDVGVAGIHRVLAYKDEIESSTIIIVIAGMEGALASVIAGLTKAPVIAVPTSVGYGSSFDGLTPLLGMLNSCVPGVAVMNIDNGFGAAFLAFKILNKLTDL